MADALVILREDDVKEARLPDQTIEKNDISVLKQWHECRGLTCTKSETHAALVQQ